MNVLIVEPEASGHRMALYVRLLLRGCAARKWTVGLLTSPRAMRHPAFALAKRESADLHVSVMKNIEASNRTDAVSLFRNQLAYYNGIARGFQQCAAEQCPDVVYVNSLDYFDKVLAFRGSPFGCVPFSGMMMDVKYHRKRMSIGPSTRSDRLYEHLFRHVLRLPTLRAATVIDEAFASYAAASAHAEYRKIRYVPDVGKISGKEPRTESRAALGVAESAFVILVYGTLTSRKGIRELLEVVVRPDAPQQIAVLLAGVQDEHTRQLLGSATAAELARARRLIVSEGFHDDAGEHRVFNAADAVWLGYVDGFFGSSGVLYQAGSMGLPVIATRGGLIGWLNDKHGLGVSADPSDSTATSSALRQLASDRTLAVRLGTNGKRFAEEHSADRFQEAVLGALVEPGQLNAEPP